MIRTLLAVCLTLGASQMAGATSTGFEDVSSGASLAANSTFTSGGIDFQVTPFPNGTSAGVSSFGFAGGSGRELALPNSIGVNLLLPATVAEVSFQFGSYHPLSGLVVNGVASGTASKFSSAHGQTLGGVAVSVVIASTPPGGNRGTVTLTGPINTLLIGGTELWIDNLSVTVPEPTGGVALLLGMATLVHARRESRQARRKA